MLVDDFSIFTKSCKLISNYSNKSCIPNAKSVIEMLYTKFSIPTVTIYEHGSTRTLVWKSLFKLLACTQHSTPVHSADRWHGTSIETFKDTFNGQSGKSKYLKLNLT